MHCHLFRFFCGFFLLSFLLAAPQPLRAAWHNTPVGYPIINSIVTDSSGSRIWLDASGAGIWTTSDGGNSWLPASSRVIQEGRATGTFRTVDPGGDTLIADVLRSSIYFYFRNYSTYDGGATWQPLDFRLIQARNARRNEWLAYGTDCLFRSPDGGQTWNNSGTIPFSVVDLYQDSRSDSGLFAAGRSDDYRSYDLWMSADLGEQWTQIFSSSQIGMPYIWGMGHVIHLSGGQFILPLMQSFVVSEDTGRTWTWTSTIPASHNEFSLIEDHGLPGRLFLLGEREGNLQRSTDGGLTWTALFEGLPDRYASEGIIYQNHFSQDLYFGSSEHGLQRSTDHGDTWQQVNLPPIGSPWSALSVTQEAVFCQNFTDSPTRQWQRESNATEWQPIALPRSDRDSISGIGSWVFFKHGDSLASLLIEYHLLDEFYISAARRALSTDNGISWSLGNPISGYFNYRASLNLCESATQRRLLLSVIQYAESSRDTLLVSYDLGQSWQPMWTPPTTGYSPIRDVVQNDSIICVTVADSSLYTRSIYLSSDSGRTWQLLNTSPEYCSNPVLVGNRISIIDEAAWSYWDGTEWADYPSLPEPISGHNGYQMTAVETGSQTLLVLYPSSNDSTIYVSSDWGRTAQVRVFEFPFLDQNLQLNSLTWDPYQQRLWASTGVGPCYLDGSELSSSDEPLHFKPADFTVLAAYPNPFNSSTRIRYDLDRQSKVQLQIFDLQGRLITTLLDDVSEPGRHELLWNADNLSSGTYFIRLHTPQTTRTQKLLLLK
jgi:hypothetical protein